MVLVYPGSFDPVTVGHIDIARRAAKFAERVIIAVLENPNKMPLFSVSDRLTFIKEAFAAEGSNIEVDSFSGLLAEYVVKKNADAILRGLRNSDDFESKYAASNSAIARSLGKDIETIFIPATPALDYVSGSIVREAAAHIYKNGLPDTFVAEHVPPSARAALEKKFKR